MSTKTTLRTDEAFLDFVDEIGMSAGTAVERIRASLSPDAPIASLITALDRLGGIGVYSDQRLESVADSFLLTYEPTWAPTVTELSSVGVEEYDWRPEHWHSDDRGNSYGSRFDAAYTLSNIAESIASQLLWATSSRLVPCWDYDVRSDKKSGVINITVEVDNAELSQELYMFIGQRVGQIAGQYNRTSRHGARFTTNIEYHSAKEGIETL